MVCSARERTEIPWRRCPCPDTVRPSIAAKSGLLCDRGFKAGEPFDLIVQGEEGADERVPCFISYCREVGTDLFRIGAKFQDYKPKDEEQ